MKKSPLNNLLLNESGIAFDPACGETFQLSASALSLIRLLQAGKDEIGLLDFLLKEYEVSEATAKRDLQSFLADLQRKDWL